MSDKELIISLDEMRNFDPEFTKLLDKILPIWTEGFDRSPREMFIVEKILINDFALYSNSNIFNIITVDVWGKLLINHL